MLGDLERTESNCAIKIVHSCLTLYTQMTHVTPFPVTPSKQITINIHLPGLPVWAASAH